MALEGTIRDFGLPDIFQLIGLQRKTGVLTLRSDKEEVTVAFENGMVVAADSSSKRLEDRLGTVLVKQGKLSKERLDEALQTQRATLQRLGHVLTAGNLITARDLKAALQVQVSQTVFKVFRWRDGEYHFAPTDSVDYDRDYFDPMSADFILMEGIRMVDEWPIIEKKIPSLDIVFRMAVDPSNVEVVNGDAPESGGDQKDAAGRIRLTGQEERIFRKVDGTRTVQSVIDVTGLSEFEVCRTLFDLLNRSLITTAGRGVSRATEAPVERAAPGQLGYVGLVAVAAVAAFAVFVQRGTPFGVTGLRPLLQGPFQRLQEDVAASRLRRLDQAILAYRLQTGALPRTLHDLRVKGLVDAGAIRDPWGRTFHFAITSDGYLLSALDAAGGQDAAHRIERSFPPGPP